MIIGPVFVFQNRNEDRQQSSGSNQMEVEVTVHSRLSEPPTIRSSLGLNSPPPASPPSSDTRDVPTRRTTPGLHDDGVGLSVERLWTDQQSHRLRSPKNPQIGLAPSPRTFVRSAIVQSTSSAHGYLCS